MKIKFQNEHSIHKINLINLSIIIRSFSLANVRDLHSESNFRSICMLIKLFAMYNVKVIAVCYLRVLFAAEKFIYIFVANNLTVVNFLKQSIFICGFSLLNFKLITSLKFARKPCRFE